MFDLLLRGGRVLDGTGAPAVEADVAVAGDTLAGIGAFPPASAKAVLDARSLLVCPGFIDTHSHSDAYLIVEPAAPSKVSQGVTTEVLGNCGASAAPLQGEYRMPSDWADKGLAGRWSTFAEYREALRSARPAPNAVCLVGHSALRGGTVGYGNRPASPDELAGMERMLEQCMDEGARGLSTGLIYPPGLFAPREEIERLAAIVGRRGGVYASHMRNESARVVESVEETIGVGRSSGARVQVSHLKVSGRDNWGLIEPLLATLHAAVAEGLPVAADCYPYTAGWTDLDVLLPDWAREGGREAILARIREPQARSRILKEMRESRAEDAWGGVTVGSTAHPDNLPFRGGPLPEAAARLGVPPAEAALVILDRDELKTSAFFHGIGEDNMRRTLAEPYVAIGSDASIRSLTGPLSHDYPHPRAYGTFPRFLRMALDGGTVPVAEAVRKMTSLPARHFGLSDRGMLRQGMKADLVALDPRTVRDTATYGSPHQLSQGIVHVIVNGVPTLRDGAVTGDRAGRVL